MTNDGPNCNGDPLKDPKITGITALILALLSPLLLKTVCCHPLTRAMQMYEGLFGDPVSLCCLPLVCAAMAMYVGYFGVRSSLRSKATGYLCLSVIGVMGGLTSLVVTLLVVKKQFGY